MIELGETVADRITGFCGVATCRAQYLNGCVRIGIQSVELDKDGKPRELEYFDESQCMQMKPSIDIAGLGSPPEAEATGGPQDPPRDAPSPR